jgi:hypothetical protein
MVLMVHHGYYASVVAMLLPRPLSDTMATAKDFYLAAKTAHFVVFLLFKTLKVENLVNVTLNTVQKSLK